MPHCDNDEEIARILQEDTNSNSARELQQIYTQEQIDSNYNTAKRLQEKYYRELDKDIPVIQKKQKKLEKKKVVSPEVSFLKLFYELLPFLLFILLIVYLSTFMFSSTKIKGSKSRKK